MSLSPATPTPSLAALRIAFAEGRRAARSRHRDLAEALGVSEGELIAAHAGVFPADQSPLQATPLRAEWPAVIGALAPAGELMALTRNPSCVHEKTGVYAPASASGPAGGEMGLVLGREIDLRIFYSRWAHGFAVAERLADGSTQRSLQFFDAQGGAVHKVFTRTGTDLVAWQAVIDRFASPAAAAEPVGIQTLPVAAPVEVKPDADVNLAAFQAEWLALKDTHEFFGLLRRHGLARTQALRLAPAGHALPLPASSAHALLQQAVAQSVSVMVFVGNAGVIQIHSGPVQRVERMGPWLNVLDAGFNLHLREDHIARAWLVKKPTTDGPVHSVEFFDASGETIAMMFGERKPGQPERADWRALAESLAVEGETCAA